MIFAMMDNKSVKTNFTIEHILNCAGEQLPNTSHSSSTNEEETCETVPFLDPYSWLQCTRYCPPKIPRVQRSRTVQKRQLGRHPRIPFTPHQLAVLEEKFKQSPYLSSEEVIELAKRLQLADIRVKIWFQNRRARERRERCVNLNSVASKNSESDSVNENLQELEQGKR